MGLTIAVDIDETIADLLPAWLDMYNEDYDDTLTPAHITSWELTRFVKRECGERIYAYLKPSLYQDVKPIEDAWVVLDDLRREGNRIVFVTSTPRGCEGAKLEWLVRNVFLDKKGSYGDGRVYDDYLEVHDKSLVRADVLIDDRPENLFGFQGFKILFEANHNKSFPGSVHGDIVRAKNWDEVRKQVDVITRGLSAHVTETKCPQQAKGFRELTDKFYKVHLDKNADYSPANILGTGEIGLATRIWDKTIRYMNLLGFDIKAELIAYTGPKSAKNESIEDTLQDLSVYGIIGLLMRSGKWGK